MKTRKIRLVLAALLFASLAWADDPCPCPGETPYAGTDACGNDVCDSNDVDTYPYMDACGNGVCDPDLDGEYPDTAYDCDGDGELDSCEPCGSLEISGPSFLLANDTIELSAEAEDLDGNEFTWSIEGGTINLQSTSGSSIDVDGNTIGNAIIKVTHDDSGISTTHQVTTYHITASIGGSFCDGEELSFTLVANPKSVESEISNVSITATKPDGSTNFTNVENKGTSFQQKSPVNELKWVSGPHGAMWYSSGQGDCNNPAIVDYTLKANYNIEGIDKESAVGGFSVDAVVGAISDPSACLQGVAGLTEDWYDGFPGYIFEPVEGDEDNWKLNIQDIGTLERDLNTYTDLGNTLTSSQFYPMILAEEEYHVDQIEGNVASAIDPQKHFSVVYVYENKIENFETTVHLGENPTIAEIEAAADTATGFVDDELEDHFINSVQELSNDPNYRCPIEKQAKQAAGSQFHLTYRCTYRQTGFCP